jgi:hypothetical protein
MVAGNNDLWTLALERQQIDPAELAEAVQQEASLEELDFRTRLLIRDSIQALRRYWGSTKLGTWLEECPSGSRINSILEQELGEPGFPSLQRRVVEITTPETVRQFLRDLGSRLHRPVRMHVGGSIALILPGYLKRRTEDVDVVDEVPAVFRSQHKLLHELKDRYNLQLTHFQSHYLPNGWERRLHTLEPFGALHVSLVDPCDVFLSKLSSKRTKDLDDLRALAPQLSKETLSARLRETTASLLTSESLHEQAKQNWYIVYGEQLPT